MNQGQDRTRHFIDIAVGALSALVCLTYACLLIRNIGPYWFDSRWTTDDALQQLFPFHAVTHPHLFAGDLVYEAMRGYLAPLHYALGATLTYLTKSPIMTGHWVMLVQFTLSAWCLFLAVKSACQLPGRSWWYGAAPAFFALFWFMHSRQLVQRMTGGLPRGWAPVILCAYLLFVIRGNHRAVIAVLAAGCLLNPPAAFLACAAYGLYLLVQVLRRDTRPAFLKPFLTFALAAPLLAALTLYVTARPAHIGRVATLEEARALPEFQRNGGRFAFLPFEPVAVELRKYSFRAFESKMHKAGPRVKARVAAAACLLLCLCIAAALRLRAQIIPLPVLIFAAAAILVYLISRPLAFRLYVPDRHLTYPLGIFFVIGLSSGVWKLFARRRAQDRYAACFGAGALAVIALMFFLAHGSGLQPGKRGMANFNYHDTLRGGAFNWIRAQTPETALFAGEPTFLDPIQLYGMRKGYVTSETWHPFYGAYNAEMKRRLDIVLRAVYARDAREFVRKLRAEKIAYFVFDRRMFRPQGLKKAGYLEPFDALVRELAGAAPAEYVFYKLPRENKKVVPYADARALVVNVEEFARILDEP